MLSPRDVARIVHIVDGEEFTSVGFVIDYKENQYYIISQSTVVGEEFSERPLFIYVKNIKELKIIYRG